MKLSVQYPHPECALCARGDCIQELKHSEDGRFMVLHGHGQEHLSGSWIMLEEGQKIFGIYKPFEPSTEPLRNPS